ncbi:hypothetical protein [Pararhizobium gei]|uniref:hypothetical protein n=1 Tax=Pararhizobium gei TaxID=1395951 RepID=UPI0023DB8114|nr:hypothetical protein [Rhizobium gei]
MGNRHKGWLRSERFAKLGDLNKTGDSMPIYFKTATTPEAAFELIEQRLTGPSEQDGYLDVLGAEDEQSMSWSKGTSASGFKATLTDTFRTAWQDAPFWLAYTRTDSDELGINDIRKAAISLTRPYNSVTIITFSLLGRRDSAHDLEFLFLCFRDEVERRNFRVRYEGKFVASPTGIS